MASWKLLTGVAVAAATLIATIPAAEAVTTTSSLSSWEANVGAFSETALFSGINPISGPPTVPYAAGQSIAAIPLSLAGSVGYTNGASDTGGIWAYGGSGTPAWSASWGTGTTTDIVVGASSTSGSNISIGKTSDYGFGFLLQGNNFPAGTTEPVTVNLLGSKGVNLGTVTYDLTGQSTSGSAQFFGYFGDALAGVQSVQIVTSSTCGKTLSGPCAIGIGDFFESAAAPSIPAPEPATLTVLGSGLVGLGLLRRRRAAKAK